MQKLPSGGVLHFHFRAFILLELGVLLLYPGLPAHKLRMCAGVPRRFAFANLYGPFLSYFLNLIS